MDYYMHFVGVSKTAFHIEIIVLAGLLILVGVLAVNALRPAPVIVNVTSVTWSSFGETLSSGPGWRTTVGSQDTLVLQLTNGFFGTVTFTSASLNESGFRLISSNLPSIPAGTTGNLTVTVAVPSTSYTGPLEIILA